MLKSEAVAQEFVAQVGRRFEQGYADADARLAAAENVRTVQEMYAAVCAGDYDRAVGRLADDVEFEMIGPAPAECVRKVRGKEALAAALRQNFAAVEEQQPDVEMVVAEGNMVSVFGRERGRVRDDGRAYLARWLQVFILRGDRIGRIREYIAYVSYGEGTEPAPA
jgi:ketosteroid isomerase-like protein